MPFLSLNLYVILSLFYAKTLNCVDETEIFPNFIWAISDRKWALLQESSVSISVATQYDRGLSLSSPDKAE